MAVVNQLPRAGFSNQKSQYGYIEKAFGMETFGIFYEH
jgi:hypothetical protein